MTSTPERDIAGQNVQDSNMDTVLRRPSIESSPQASPTTIPTRRFSQLIAEIPGLTDAEPTAFPEEQDAEPLSLDIDSDLFGDIEDVAGDPNTGQVIPWSYPSPPISQSSTPLNSTRLGPAMSIDLDPEFSGLLHGLFHEQTCGILSIKNGPNENPWATMLWPMVFQDAALYYATLSMTALHASSHIPGLQVKGLELMTTSIALLRGNMSGMRSDAALATALILAFSESWHSHIYTGIHHLRGARDLIMQGLRHQERAFVDPQNITRMKFLQGTWVYMDVIARLTALGGDDPEDLDSIVLPTYGPENIVHEIDPLMGCATTLFPLIGAVASLIKRIRKIKKPRLQDVTRAAELRDQVLKWRLPSRFVPPRDGTLEIDHSRHTAEAYRWATVLYLYQSVPMVCTRRPSELAELTLRHLAAVPITSRATIIHIFPLLAAGCEATTDDDRAFVAERWEAMINRMGIGNLDRCWDVVKEVWSRRDFAEQQRQQRRLSQQHSEPSPNDRRRRESFSPNAIDANSENERSRSRSRSSSPMREEIKMCVNPKNMVRRPRSKERSKEQGPGNMVKIDDEVTVRGSLHWVAVMTENKWESMFIPPLPPSCAQACMRQRKWLIW